MQEIKAVPVESRSQTSNSRNQDAPRAMPGGFSKGKQQLDEAPRTMQPKALELRRPSGRLQVQKKPKEMLVQSDHGICAEDQDAGVRLQEVRLNREAGKNAIA